MKEQVGKLIKENGPHTFKQAKKALGIYGYEDSKKLNSVLRQLVKDKVLFYKKSTETYQVKDKREIVGTFFETKQDYGFVDVEGGESYFIPAKFTLNALHGDSVRILILPSRIEGKGDIGKIVRVMKRNGNNLVGTVYEEDGLFKLEIADLSSKHDHILLNPGNVKVGDVVVCKFVDFEDYQIKVKVKENLGPQITNNDWLIVAKRNNLDLNFDKEVLDEANNLLKEKLPKREDISDRLIVTIDGASSKDLDDAIDVVKLDNGNFRLGVHIADVSHYVREGSKIDEEARKRGTSVYLMNKVIPMLPEVLSNDLCSLNPHTKKLAMSVDMEVNPEGEVVNIRVYESIIESKYRLTYKEVEQLLDKEIEILHDKELSNMLFIAEELALLSRKVKVEKGMIDFALPELKVVLDENDKPTDLLVSFQSKSEKLIEDLMVLTNESVARYLDDKETPALFRIHNKPQVENMEKFINNLKFFGYLLDKDPEKVTNKDLMNLVSQLDDSEHSSLIIKRMLVQTMEKAVYSPFDTGHYGQGLDEYLHFTSPIRRYPDLIVHRTIKDYIFNKTKTEPKSDERMALLNELAKETSERERISMAAERKLMDIKKTRLMADKVGEHAIGTVVTITDFGMFIELDNFTQGLAKYEQWDPDEIINTSGQKVKIIKGDKQYDFKLGEKIDITISGIDIAKGLMDFTIHESGSKE